MTKNAQWTVEEFKAMIKELKNNAKEENFYDELERLIGQPIELSSIPSGSAALNFADYFIIELRDGIYRVPYHTHWDDYGEEVDLMVDSMQPITEDDKERIELAYVNSKIMMQNMQNFLEQISEES